MDREQRRKSLMALSEQQGHRGLLDVSGEVETHQLLVDEVARQRDLAIALNMQVRDLEKERNALRAKQARYEALVSAVREDIGREIAIKALPKLAASTILHEARRNVGAVISEMHERERADKLRVCAALAVIEAAAP